MMSMQIPNTDTMKFGPEWLQQMNESSGCAGSTPLSNKVSVTKSSVYSRTRLHGRQYGVEKLISIWSKVLAFPPELTSCPDILVTDSSQIVSPVSMRTAMEMQKQQELSNQKQPFARGRGSGTSGKGMDIPIRGGGATGSRGLGRRPGHTGFDEVDPEMHHGGSRSISQTSSNRGRGRIIHRGATTHGYLSSSQPPSHDRIGDPGYDPSKNGEEEYGGVDEEHDDSSGEWQQVGAGGRMRQMSHNSVESFPFEMAPGGDMHSHPQTFSRMRSVGHPSQGGGGPDLHQGNSWRQRQRTKSGGDKQGSHPFQNSSTQPSHQQRRTFYTPSNSATVSTHSHTKSDHQRSYSGESQDGDSHTRQNQQTHLPVSRNHPKRSRTTSRTEDVVLEDFFEDAPGNPVNSGSKSHSQRRVQLSDEVQFAGGSTTLTQSNCLNEENENLSELSVSTEPQHSASSLDVGWLASRLKLITSTTGGIEKMDEEQLKEVLKKVLTLSDSSPEPIKQKVTSEKLTEASGGGGSSSSISIPINLGLPTSVSPNVSAISPLSGSNSVNEPIGKANCQSMPSMPEATIQWFYLDPKGNEQGPFPSSSMWQWFENGYFPDALRVKRSCDNQYLTLQIYKQLYRCSNPFLETLPPLPLGLLEQASANSRDGVKEWNTGAPSHEEHVYQTPSLSLHPSPSRYPPVTSTSASMPLHPTTMETTQGLNAPPGSMVGQQMFNLFYSSGSSIGSNARESNLHLSFPSPSNDQIVDSAVAPGFRRSLSLTAPAPVCHESDRPFANPPTDLILSNQSHSGLQVTTAAGTYPSGLSYNAPVSTHPSVNSSSLKAHPPTSISSLTTSRLLGGESLPSGVQAENPSGYFSRSNLPSTPHSSTGVSSAYHPQHSASQPPNHLINRSFSNVVPSSIIDPVISTPSAVSFLPISTSHDLNNIRQLNPPGLHIANSSNANLDGFNPSLRDFVTSNSIWSTGSITPPPNIQQSPEPLFDIGGLVRQDISLLSQPPPTLEDDDSLLPFVSVNSNKKNKKSSRELNEDRRKGWEGTFQQGDQARLQEEEEHRRLAAIQQEQEAAEATQRLRLDEEQRRLASQMHELPQSARWGAGSLVRNDNMMNRGMPSLVSIQQAEQQLQQVVIASSSEAANKISQQRPGAWAASISVTPSIIPISSSGKTLAEIQAEELKKEEARQQEEREVSAAREMIIKLSASQGSKGTPSLWTSKVKQSLPPPSSSSSTNSTVNIPVSTSVSLSLGNVSSSTSTVTPSAPVNAAPLISIWGSAGLSHTPSPLSNQPKQVSVTPGPVSKPVWPGLSTSHSVDNSPKAFAQKGGKTTVSSGNTSMQGELDALKSVIAQSRPTNPLTEWAKNRVHELFAGGNIGGVLDLGTLIDITSDMPDEGEVTDMFKEYLGDSEMVRGFTTEFLEQRRANLRFGPTPSGWLTASSHKSSTKVSTNVDKRATIDQGVGVWQSTTSKSGNTVTSGASGNANSGSKKKKKSQKIANQSVRIL